METKLIDKKFILDFIDSEINDCIRAVEICVYRQYRKEEDCSECHNCIRLDGQKRILKQIKQTILGMRELVQGPISCADCSDDVWLRNCELRGEIEKLKKNSDVQIERMNFWSTQCMDYKDKLERLAKDYDHATATSNSHYENGRQAKEELVKATKQIEKQSKVIEALTRDLCCSRPALLILTTKDVWKEETV